MPLDSSPAGRGIDSAVARIRRDMSAFGVAGFDTTFLLPTDTLSGALVQAAIVDPVTGFGYNRIPFRTAFRYGLGDVEVAAKYRLLAGAHYAARRRYFAATSTSICSPSRSAIRSEEHTSELQSPCNLVCRLLLEKKNKK